MWRVIALFVIFSLALSTLSGVVGSSGLSDDAQLVAQGAFLVTGFVSLAVLIYVLVKLDRRKSDDAN